MVYLIDDFFDTKSGITRRNIDDKWVVARPAHNRSIPTMIKEIWGYIKGKYDMVRFYKQ